MARNGELRVRPDLGDAGEPLDAKAKAAYKARPGELEAELEEAERRHDPGRAGAGAERDFLVAELARGVELRGRNRRAASHADRDIRMAMANLAPHQPAPGPAPVGHDAHGPVLVLHPDPRAPITWEL